MKKTKNILLLLLIICSSACKDDYTICSESKTVNFVAGFYRNINGTAQAATATSLSVYLLNVPSPVYSQVSNAPSFAIPLNPIADSARFVIAVSNSAQTDTLTLLYNTQNKTLSVGCGDISVNNILSAHCTDHSIQSISVVRPAVNTDGVQNLRLFLY